MKALCIAVLGMLVGCGVYVTPSQFQDSAQQIKLVNELIDSQSDPAFGRLSRDPKLNTVKIDGFDFLKGKNVADFEKLLAVARRVTIAELPERNWLPLRMANWIDSKDQSTTYLMFDTDLWGLGNGSQSFDLLVFATNDGTITDWGLFPLVPY
jgi:hypothetical protein